MLVWDEPKRRANLEARGLDFADLDPEFMARSMVIPAKLGRYKAIGEAQGAILTVIFRPLGSEAVPIVSMRHASRKERRAYDET